MPNLSTCRSAAFFAICLATTLLAAFPASASDGSLSPSVIGMFPKDMGSFAYADMKNIQKDPSFLSLFDQLIPLHFEQFKAFAINDGLDFETQIQEIAWGTIDRDSSDQVMGVAVGQFTPNETEQQLQAQQVPMSTFDGYHLFAFGTGNNPGDLFFAFISSDTAVFGTRPGIERLIGIRMNGEQSLLANETLLPLIQEANGHGLIWGIFDQKHTKIAIDELMPQATTFPEAAAIIKRVHALIIHAASDDGVVIQLEAKCDSVDDANLLALALQTEIMYQQYQGKSSSNLVDLLGHLNVRPSGADLNANVVIGENNFDLLSQIQNAMPHM